MSPKKKIIAVVGATGNQGGSVSRTFLSLSPAWTVRCLTRNPASAAAKSLAAQGAEIVKASLDDPESLESAFRGANVVFVNTDFWGNYLSLTPSEGRERARETARDIEVRHAKNAARAAAAACGETLERYIYSALGPMNRASGGKYPHANHWETKAAAVDFIENEMPALAAKTSFIYISCYATNSFLFPKPNPSSNVYQLLINARASTLMPVIDVPANAGRYVHALLSEPPRTKLLAYDASNTVAETVGIWSKVTGNEAEIVQVGMEEMQKRTGMTLEILCAPPFIDEYGYMGGIEGWIGPEKLKNRPQTQNYEEFLRQQSSDVLLDAKFFVA